MAAKKTNTGKWKVIALVALFGVTFGSAYILAGVGWRPSAMRNYGELVQPPRPLPEIALTDIGGQRVAAPLKGKWSLVYFGSAECGKPCTDTLYKMRQLEDARGRDAHRVRRVFIVTDARAVETLRHTLTSYSGTAVYVGPVTAIQALAVPFTLPAGSPLDNRHRLYVVDPLGNFMMSYPADAELRRMNKDIGVLLRNSQVG